ncbi:MAG: WG repeat-containing protein [Actinoplanes sp.]
MTDELVEGEATDPADGQTVEGEPADAEQPRADDAAPTQLTTAESAPAPEPEWVTESEPAADNDLAADTEQATDTDPAADAEPAADNDPATDTEPAPDAEQATDAEPTADDDPAADAEPTAEAEPSTEAAAAGEPDSGDEPGTAAGAQAEPVPGASAVREALKPDPTPIRQQRDQGAQSGPATSRRADPEQVLAAYPLVFHPDTLREEIEDADPMWVVIDRLTDKLEYAERDAVRARLLSVRAVASRLAGDLDAALEDGRTALEHARATGELRRIAITQARLAHVLQWRGEYAEADRLFAEANSPELPARLRAEIDELAGRSAFEQGRYLEAVNHFDSALDLRKGADANLVERIELALDTITARTLDGWGPYPRSREEILGRPQSPRPLRDERSGLWGYVGALPPRYAQAQPFAEGLAWVRRPQSPAWELIDESGAVVVDAASGYRAASRFAEGLAWVSREEVGGWYAVDRQDRVIVPGGFEDAQPFHHGLALVKRGGWGAIDRHGRIVVQPRYRGFATVLATGEQIEGFTDEGLAVFDSGEQRYGVVDRTGQQVVPPEHAALLIHPVAFLIADKYALWGALDRSGEPLVEMKYKDRADVLDEIDRRLAADARPVL